MTSFVGDAEGVASKVAVKVPVCEVMVLFCHPPPAVAVTHALEAVPSVAENNIAGKRAQGRAKRHRDKRARVFIGIDRRG
jgi:hypothetical protein